MRKSFLLLGGVVLLGGGLWYASQQGANGPGSGVAIDADDIGGVVTSANGPEAGVWVVAETNDLPTKFIRTVVTDDEGRYVIPDLPDASFDVWARGYGLVDSAKSTATPGTQVNLEPTIAPDEATAAQIYPALYWAALMEIPEKDEFPGTGDAGNGISPNYLQQARWVDNAKSNGCLACHQIGNKATRELSPALGEFDNSIDAWTRRIQSGQAGAGMVNTISRMGAGRAIQQYADWTDRVAAGEIPFEKPERPSGVERNIVVTNWEWSEPHFYLHDSISTDRRNPTVNAYGKVYGAPEASTDDYPVLDPMLHTASHISIPIADPNMSSAREDPIFQPSIFWGNEPNWVSQTSAHNPMMDQDGIVWITAGAKAGGNTDFCRAGSDHPSAQLLPINDSGRDLSRYDPVTGEWQLIRTCFQTHHLNFAEDADNTIWFSSGGGTNPREYVGWFNTNLYNQTGDEEAAQGWTAFVLDTNGNGVRDPDPVGTNDPVDPTRDTQRRLGNYSVAVSPVDGSVWGTVVPFPSGFVRMIPGDNPPETALTQYYEMPYGDENYSYDAYALRGADIDRNGVMWAGSQSGHIVSFDMRKCQAPLNGPEAATGRHCPEGWSSYEMPGPQYKNIQDQSGSADGSYYAWVDQFNTFGLGENIPIIIGNVSDSLMAVVNEEIVTIRVPYPLGFYVKGMDGRIDDPEAGWKGRGLWTTSGDRVPQHAETGVGTRPMVYNFRLRPDPLAH